MGWLTEPFAFEFMRNAFMVAALSGALCGLLGTYITLKGMSYLGHGLSHSIFGGAAVFALAGANVFLGAGVWGLLTGLAIGRVTRRRVIGADTAIGVVTTVSFALGLTLKAIEPRVNRGIDATLFGNILGVTTEDLLLVAIVSALSIAVIWGWFRPFLFSTFDPDVASASGVATGRVDAVLLALLSLATLSAMKVLGVTLIAGTLVIPAAVARLLTASFHRLVLIATAIGATGGAVGTILSYHLDTPSGPTIVLCEGATFLLVYLVRRPQRARLGGHVHA
jgi:manganese/iron transport system permease protein/iron/zinc/copper transport system permease protein